MLELFRGCTHGCRFCQAGFIYRPVRERSAAKLYEKCLELEKNTGYEELSLVSLSTSDYTELALLTDKLTDTLCKTGVNISLPSLRIDNFSIELMEKVQNVRKSGLTFAPEAGSQRLRDVINKGVTEQNLMDSVKIALEGGWHNIKLYFMLGLPGEEYEDISAIADLVYKIIVIYKDMPKEKKQKKLSINLSTSSFVPKPFTPFQWDKQNDIEELKKKQKFLKEKFKNKIVSYSWHDSKTSFLEALISRGDRNIGMVILKAWEKGCKFDTWSELFQFDRWIEAIAEAGIDADFYVNREREYDEILPWDHIDIGVERSYLINEREKAKSNELTKNCRDGCMACGASQFGGGVCYE